MRKARIAAFLLGMTLIMFEAAPFVSAAPSPSPTPAAGQTQKAEEEKSEAAVEKEKKFPEPRAKAALLVDMKGNNIVYQLNQDERMYPASITKIMTAMLALEKGNLADVITVSEAALDDITYLHSKIDLKIGEEMTLDNLLTALLVSSANDAANVIAEYIAGDIPTFVALMNERAKELGMNNTNFANPHGFHDDNHYTTAYDIFLMTREALKNAKFCELVKIKTAKLPATNISKERPVSSTNHLISRYRNTFHYYPYATGVKTGSTTEAGSCLVSTAEKNGISLMSIVLGCDNQDQKENAYSFTDSKAMFEYVFEKFKSVSIASTTDIVSDSKVYEAKDSTRVALSPSRNISMLLPSDYKEDEIKIETKLNDEIAAPIAKGSPQGSATYSFRGKTIATVELLAANEVKRDHFLHFLHGVARVLFSPFVIIPVILIAVLLIYNAYKQSVRRKQRRRKMKSQSPRAQASYKVRSQYHYNTPNRRGYSGGTGRPTQRGGSVRRPNSSRGNGIRRGPGSQRRPTNSRPGSRNGYTDPWDKYR